MSEPEKHVGLPENTEVLCEANTYQKNSTVQVLLSLLRDVDFSRQM